MTKLITLNTFQEIFYTEKMQRGSDVVVADDLFEFDHTFVRAVHRVIQLDEICIIYRDWNVIEPIIMHTRHEQPFLKMQFEIEGHSAYSSKIITSCKNVDILHGKHTLLFLPEVDGHLYYPKSRKVLDIVFTPHYFQRLFGAALPTIGPVGQAIQTNTPMLGGKESMPITPQMSQIITEILRCNFQGIFKKTYLEAKVIELLNLQIDQFHQSHTKSMEFKLRKDDIDRLYYIKEMIQKEPMAHYSLMQLAELAGLNDFKLKKGFKQLFGSTVFGFITDTRLDIAYQLLQDDRYNVTHVADMIGYKHPHHFTKAFKKKFGILPKTVKN